MDPRAYDEEDNFTQWDRNDWNIFLKKRIPADYGRKQINSVIIQQVPELLESFSKTNPGHTAGPEFHWSSKKLPSVVMKLVSLPKAYDIYRCPPAYILARLDSSQKPMHFHGYASTQKSSGQLPANVKDCLKIDNKSDP